MADTDHPPLDQARDLIRQSLKTGAPGLAEPAREAVVRSIMLKLEGHGLLSDVGQVSVSRRLREALKLFARAFIADAERWPDEAVLCRGITFGHLRAARAAMRQETDTVNEPSDQPERSAGQALTGKTQP